MSLRAACVSMLLMSALAYGQSPPALVSFEVASVKPAVPINPFEIAQTGKMPRLGMNIAGTRVDIGYMSLADLIPVAFNVKPFQVVGPSWMRDQRFDIVARMPEGTTKEQVPEMLQSLLAERFHLKIRRENREQNVYALVVARGGHKLKESPPDPETPPAADAKDAKDVINIGGTQIRVENRGAITTMTSPQTGAIRMSMSPDGQMRMEYGKITMTQFADMITRFTDRPVVDMTELQGNYQVVLDLAMADMLNIARASGVGLPAINLPAGNPALPAQAPDPSGNSIFNSVQQLGLRLDSRKAPVESIVVDQVDKMPTEN